jgi:hypothetical protein
MFGSKKNDRENLIPSLAAAIDRAQLDSAHLSVGIPCNEASEIIKDFKRNEIHLYDGKLGAIWEVGSLSELYRGNRQPPADAEMNRYPEEYVPLFASVETHVITACNVAGDRTDEEFIAIYTAMRKYPDGKDLGIVHRIVWQSAALALGFQPYSQEETEAAFAQLARSARHWRMGASSRNYLAYLRQHFTK